MGNTVAYQLKKTILEGAIEIYKRDSEGGQHSSRNWYAKLKIPDVGTKRLSLKTTVESDAIAKAQELYFEYRQRAAKGLSLSPKSFTKVAKQFLSHFEQQVEIWKTLDEAGQANMEGISENRLKNTRPIVEKYLIPFFGDKNIQEISDNDVEDYKNFRLGYWTNKEHKKIKNITYQRSGRKVTRPKRPAEQSVPSYSTINKELTAFRKVLSYACKTQLISTQDIPEIQRLKKPPGYDDKRERPSFTDKQYTHLLNSIRDNLQGQANRKHRLAHIRLYLYVQLLSFTGMRVTEAKKLRFKDIEKRNSGEPKEHLVLWVSGKNKRRDLVPFSQTGFIIEQFRYMHSVTSKKHEWVVDENTYLLTDERGNRINSFSTALSNALEKCGLLFAENGARRSASSFRSYYITSALNSGKMTHIQLARNCGTSVSVIEKHYNRMSPSNFPDKFNFWSAATDTYSEHMIENIEKKIPDLAKDGIKMTVTRVKT